MLQNLQAGLSGNITSFEGLPQPRYMYPEGRARTLHLFTWHDTVFEVLFQETLHEQ